MKKKSSSTVRLNANMIRNLLIGYAILASTLALFFIATFLPVYLSQQRTFSEMDFKMLTRETALSFYDSPQLLPGGDKLYIPELKLAIPITPGEGQVLYKHEIAVESTPSDSFPETVTFVSKSAVNALLSQDGDFECQKLAVVTFGAENTQLQYEPFVHTGEARLADGRTIHVYQNKKQSCTRVWQGMNSDEFVRQLKLATPYPAI